MATLFGEPQMSAPQAGGLAVWNKFGKKTIFGESVCFKKIILKDEPGIDFLGLYVEVPMSMEDAWRMDGALPGLGCDGNTDMLWAHCSDLDMGVMMLELATSALIGRDVDGRKMSAQFAYELRNLNMITNTMAKIAVVTPLYKNLCANLRQLVLDTPPRYGAMESFSDEPWYGLDVPFYASNDPGDLALGDAAEENYYRRDPANERLYQSSASELADNPEGDYSLSHAALAPVPPREYMTGFSSPLDAYYDLGMPVQEHLTLAQAYRLFKPNPSDVSQIYGIVRPGSATAAANRQMSAECFTDPSVVPYSHLTDPSVVPYSHLTNPSVVPYSHLTHFMHVPINYGWTPGHKPEHFDTGLPYVFPDDGNVSMISKQRRDLSDLDVFNAFQPGSLRMESMSNPLFSVGSHMARLERLTDRDLYSIFRRGSARAPLLALVTPDGHVEKLDPDGPVSVAQAMKLFMPRFPLTKKSALRMEKMTSPLTVHQAYTLFSPIQADTWYS
jgi:hypothetical protein